MNTISLNSISLDGNIIRKGASGGGGNVSLMTEVTWQELKDLRDSGKLIAGMKYRMIDYDTYTSQEGTQSAMHPFDLILTALDNKTLSEECSAIQSARDVDGYFANSNLGAWKIWYCLDNDVNRFDWAAEKGISITNLDGDVSTTFVCQKLQHPNIVVYDENQNEISGVELYLALSYGEEEGVLAYICVDGNVTVGENPMYMVCYNSNDYTTEVNGMVIPPQSGAAFIMSIINVTAVSKSDIVGKGVIYRLIDGEMNNDIYYDFKNIMFKSPNGDSYFFTMGSTPERDDSILMGNIKITREPAMGGEMGMSLVNVLNLGEYYLDPRNFDNAGMGSITIVNCPKIRLYPKEGYMDNLYFENCSIDYNYASSNTWSGNIRNSSFKNVNGTFVFSNSASNYNNLDVDGVMPTEGIYDGSIKTYIRAKADGTPFAFTADDIYNAISATKTE